MTGFNAHDLVHQLVQVHVSEVLLGIAVSQNLDLVMCLAVDWQVLRLANVGRPARVTKDLHQLGFERHDGVAVARQGQNKKRLIFSQQRKAFKLARSTCRRCFFKKHLSEALKLAQVLVDQRNDVLVLVAQLLRQQT